MAHSKRTVLVTGTSEGGLGDALARALHAKGFRVFAAGRNAAKIAHFKALGIETALFDVLDAASISRGVAEVSSLTGGTLDMLINNSGGGYSMPLADADLNEARKLFELNVWAVLAVTQAFLPLLLASAKTSRGAVIANNTSLVSVLNLPFGGVYNASKAAAAMLSDNLRVELAPFGITVVDLKTGSVKSRFFENQVVPGRLPPESIYEPIRDLVEKSMTGGTVEERGQMDSEVWARKVVAKLVGKPPPRIWCGEDALLVRVLTAILPIWVLDSVVGPVGGVDVLKKKLAQTKSG